MIIDKTPLAFDSVANGVSIYPAKVEFPDHNTVRPADNQPFMF